MDKRFLCLTSIDGYRMRLRADSVLEYGDLYREDRMENDNQIVVGEKTVIGSFINTVHGDDESTWVTETVDQIDEMFSSLGFEYEHASEELGGRDTDPAPSPASLDEAEYSNLFDRVWKRYKESQPEDPSKWTRVSGDCADCPDAGECGRAVPDNPDEEKMND